MHKTLGLLTGAAALGAIALFSTPAHAGIGACGNINIEANAECELEAGVSCEAGCTLDAFNATCAADLEVECGGMCNASIEAGCEADCSGSCMASCMGDPGSFECAGSCKADCGGSCSASCEGSENGAECMASCEATCGAECDASCEVTPPEASCMAKCDASCSGSCQAEANLDCQVMCQAEGYAECKVEIEGECKADCMGDGALYCDGEYIDHGGNLEECVNALKALFDIEVSGYASCDGNSCEAGGEATLTCNVAPEQDQRGWLFGVMLAGGLLAGAGRVRRRL